MVIPDQVLEAEARYRLLETLCQYGLEHLRQDGELDAVQRRHAHYYAAFAQRAGTALIGPEELGWRPRLRAEQDNLHGPYGGPSAQVHPATASMPWPLRRRWPRPFPC